MVFLRVGSSRASNRGSEATAQVAQPLAGHSWLEFDGEVDARPERRLPATSIIFCDIL